MNEQAKKVTAAAGSLLMVASMGVAASASADGAEAHAAEGAALEQAAVQTPALVSEDTVEGDFAFSQGIVTSVETIKKNFAKASQYLCGGQATGSGALTADPGEWVVSVRGEVGDAFSATLDEMAEEGSAQLVMGCTCMGNPAGGRAMANAEVLGVKLAYIMDRAHVDEGVNTVVFTSSDGYETALPLSYVKQHFSLIAYDVNGEPVANTMGGSNQLWLGSTAASYFSRNVETITFETRQTPPPRPGSAEAGDVYSNAPGVSVIEGGVV